MMNIRAFNLHPVKTNKTVLVGHAGRGDKSVPSFLKALRLLEDPATIPLGGKQLQLAFVHAEAGLLKMDNASLIEALLLIPWILLQRGHMSILKMYMR